MGCGVQGVGCMVLTLLQEGGTFRELASHTETALINNVSAMMLHSTIFTSDLKASA